MNCRLCSGKTFPFLDLGMQPLANKYPKADEFEKEKFFHMIVEFCEECTNIQMRDIISREIMFEDYYYLSSVNKGLVRHFEKLAKELQGFVVDIGSNDGILLKPLKEQGTKFLGIDPSINVSKMANDMGLETLVGFFDVPMAKRVVSEYGKADVAVASSIFTHVEDPHEFIEGLKVLLDEQGKALIEVEYSLNIIKNVQFERFYFDRPYYYSVTSLAKLFEQHGMVLTDVEDIEPHGGSIRVIVKNSGEQSEAVKNHIEQEQHILNAPYLGNFQEQVVDWMDSFKKKIVGDIAGYSCPARVSTITNYGRIDSTMIPFIVDDSPLKQGRFSPGMHIPIVSSDMLKDKPGSLLVFAYEYLDDIKQKTGNQYNYITP